MKHLPNKLHKKLEDRKVNNAFRQLGSYNTFIDFSSNDYLGLSRSKDIFNASHQYLIERHITGNGATGSRLLSGNHELYTEVENQLCNTYNSDAALICNSGYNANIGVLSSVPQRGDIVLYDELAHASIRDGITMSNAKSYKFKHNDLHDLEGLLKRMQQDGTDIFIVTESVFSMDGDSPDLETLLRISNDYKAHLIIDEAHAVGVFNTGLIQQLGLEKDVFARIVTFGKAPGCHGAVILGSKDLKDYLINFSRPFIYTTALSPHALATISVAHQELERSKETEKLKANIALFKSEVIQNNLSEIFINSQSAIHCCIIPGNENVKTVAQQLQNKGFDVKPILSPTVPKGKERLRFCLHSYNSRAEISEVLSLLANFALV